MKSPVVRIIGRKHKRSTNEVLYRSDFRGKGRELIKNQTRQRKTLQNRTLHYVSDNPTDKDCFSRFRREICSSRFRRALYVYVIVEFCVLYKTKKK